jgi:hypothetical protein
VRAEDPRVDDGCIRVGLCGLDRGCVDAAESRPRGVGRWLDCIVYMAVAVSGGGDVSAAEVARCMGGNIYMPLLLVEEVVGRRMLRTGSRIVYLAYAQKQYDFMAGATA